MAELIVHGGTQTPIGGLSIERFHKTSTSATA
jgi:sarcosine oxidase subunit beta